MKRGEVWWVNFDPSVGEEIRKLRPAVIVSNDSSNRALNRFQVVPMSSKIGRLYPSEAYVLVNGGTSKVMADQITTVSRLRFQGIIGTLSYGDVGAVERVVKKQLGII